MDEDIDEESMTEFINKLTIEQLKELEISCKDYDEFDCLFVIDKEQKDG